MTTAKDTVFERALDLGQCAETVWQWHMQREALERMIPPWENAKVDAPAAIVEGAKAKLQVQVGPFTLPWSARISEVRDGHHFVDEMEGGPFKRWSHEHRVEPQGEHARLVDRVHYRLPLEPFSAVASGVMTRRLDRMFRYRHDTLKQDLRVHDELSSSPLRVGVTGASGLLGTALGPFLSGGGHTVVALSRRPTADDLRGLDAVVHLAGEPVASSRWTAAKKKRILDSRVHGTHSVAETIASLEPEKRPKVLVCASAVGLYGNRGDEVLPETAARGEGFLADVVDQWEQATKPALDAGVRVSMIRLGIILAGNGGALERMTTPFSLGLGGPVGDPSAWVPWISIDDVLDVILRCVVDENASGPINAVTGAVTQKEFAKTIGKVMRRPSVTPVPQFAVRLALGAELADSILASARVEPRRLRELGHTFRHPTLQSALRHVLGKGA